MYDADFVRAWRLYLSGSAAAFATGSLQLFQVVFAPGKSNAVPMTREHMYPRPTAGLRRAGPARRAAPVCGSDHDGA